MKGRWGALGTVETMPGEQDCGNGARQNDGREISCQITVVVAVENYVVKLPSLLHPDDCLWLLATRMKSGRW